MVEPGTGRNHYLLRAQLADGTPLRFLLNLPVGMVATADDQDPHDLQARFLEVPCPDVFTLAGLRIADPADLEQPLTDSHIAGLTEAERNDIAYTGRPGSVTSCSTGSTDHARTGAAAAHA